MQRGRFMRPIALLAVSLSVSTAAAAPPSATIGQIDSRIAKAATAPPLGSPPTGADLARTTQIPPENRTVIGDQGNTMAPVTAPEADLAECFLGPQISAIAAALPLENSGLGDLCLSLVWLENEARPRATDRGARSLQRQEPAPQLPDPEPSDIDALGYPEASPENPESYVP